MTTKFPLGQTVVTAGIHSHMSDPHFVKEIQDALRRHASGDWGEVGDADKQANDHALTDDTRLLSAYTVAGLQVWVITEADRSSTTVLFPDEY